MALFFGFFYIDTRAPHLVRATFEFFELLVHAGVREQAGGFDPLDAAAEAFDLGVFQFLIGDAQALGAFLTGRRGDAPAAGSQNKTGGENQCNVGQDRFHIGMVPFRGKVISVWRWVSRPAACRPAVFWTGPIPW